MFIQSGTGRVQVSVTVSETCFIEMLFHMFDMIDAFEWLETQVRDGYENIQSQSTPSTEIRRKMDSCTAVTTDLMGLMKVSMSEVGQENSDTKAENTRESMPSQYLGLQSPNLLFIATTQAVHQNSKASQQKEQSALHNLLQRRQK